MNTYITWGFEMKILLTIYLIFVNTAISWGWDNKITHQDLTFYAAHRYYDPIDPAFLGKSYALDGVEKTGNEGARHWCAGENRRGDSE